MKLNRKLMLILAVVLSVAMAAGGTMAYLQDTDEDVNVMTLGKVEIRQHEYERVQNADGTYATIETESGIGYKLKDFSQDKPLFPAVGDYTVMDDTLVYFDQLGENAGGEAGVAGQLENVQDKFVVVENTGKSNAYVRTLFAFEGTDALTEYLGLGITEDWAWNDPKLEIVVDGATYVVMEAVYVGSADRHADGILPAGEWTPSSLSQVFLAPEATNEVVEGLDTNKNGKYDILVLSQAVQVQGFEGLGADGKSDAQNALDTAFGLVNEKNSTEWFNGVYARYKQQSEEEHWDGTVDTSWYNDTDTEFVLTTAEQLAGLAKLVDDGKTFEGKTVKLGNDICLGCTTGECANNEDGNPFFFDPIGDASNADFSGTFDGQNKTIYNLRQDCNSKHLGLFGAVYEGTVKNLVLDGARIENDGTGYAAAVASYTGASTFENITLRNTTVANYNHNTAGIAAWVSNNGTTTTFDGINIEDTTTIASWWGSPDTRVGGIVGAMNTGNNVVIKNATVACRLDVYNDVVSNYQWYNYRMAGMVVGDVRDYHTVDGRTEANPVRVTCENVTVVFGDWANYHYCESASYGTPSYADEGEYKFHRVESGEGYGGVDTSACNHNADETHNELIAFDFLFGARDGKGIYGISAFDGVTVVK